MSIGQACQGVVDHHLLWFTAGKTTESCAVPLAVPQQFVWCGKRVTVEKIVKKQAESTTSHAKSTFQNRLNYAIIKNNWIWRTREIGDTFRPKGRGCTKSLKKLLQEAKLPKQQRDTLLVLACGHTLAYVEGFGVAEGFGVSSPLESAIEITIEKENVDCNKP